ncbi:hypothetical protein [Uniformispora flossi]|uniref:hypothetical protein n=1 Tax=Uniformispora flossi TaxID=3390723 RepID=UPI003D034D6F
MRQHRPLPGRPSAPPLRLGNHTLRHTRDLTAPGGLPGRRPTYVNVLDRDPYTGPADEIAATRVARTYVGGRLVHAAE